MVDIPPSILPPGVPGAGSPKSNNNTSFGRVIKPHKGADFSELTLTIGDVIKITSQGESGYWSGTLNGASGVFPSTCVEIIKNPIEIKKLSSPLLAGRGRGRGRGGRGRGRGRGKGGMRHSSYTPASQGLNQNNRKKKVVSGHYKNSPLVTPPASAKIPPPVSSKLPPPPVRVKNGIAIPPPIKNQQAIGIIPPPVNINKSPKTTAKKSNSIPGSIPPPIKGIANIPKPVAVVPGKKSNSSIQFNNNPKKGALVSPKTRFRNPPALGGSSGSQDDVPPRSPRKMPTEDDLPQLPHRVLKVANNHNIGLPPAVQPRKKIGNELAEKLGNLNIGGKPPVFDNPHRLQQTNNENINESPENDSGSLNEEDEKKLKKIEKHKRLRENALTEIWDTERDYIIDIELIISVFIIPLRAMKIVHDQVLYHIFSNLETLINCNREMEKLFNEIFKNGVSADLLVGEVFTKMADYLKMYKIYCSNQQTSLTTVELQKKKNQKFKSYMEVCHSDERCKGLTLQSFLIKPIQRVCKYPLLLRELIKYTPEEHPDYDELQSAFEKINSVVSDINEAQRVAEGLQRILELQEIIDGVDTLVAPGRRYIKEGDLIWYKSGKSKHGEKRHIFVFSDLLLLCNKKGSNKYEKKLAMPLEKAKIIVLSDTNYIKHALEVTQPTVKTRCIIAVGSVEQQKTWIKEIKGLIKDFQLKQLRELKQEQKRKANSFIN